jgi:hypothetical protein
VGPDADAPRLGAAPVTRMAGDRFQRFRHLERRRTATPPPSPEAAPGTEGRFEALEERREGEAPASTPEPVASGHLDRFRPAAERPLELATGAPGELPFVRCARCQVDANRAASTCAQCGADLWTDERAFNERLAAQRHAEAAVEEAEVAELERRRDEASAEQAHAMRTAAEELARAVGDAERRRLDAGGLGGGPGSARGLGLGGWILGAVLRFLFRTRLR